MTRDEKWNENLQLYVEFKNTFNREPLIEESYRGFNIAAWIRYQRTLFRNGSLPESRKQELQAVGIELEPIETDWQKNFELYKLFKEEHGREPKQTDPLYHGSNLKNWVRAQRKNFKDGSLYRDREQKLMDAGFVFLVQDTKWEENLALYKAFKATFGKEPEFHDCYQGVQIGRWVATQRTAYRNNTLYAEREQKLQEAGFVFRPSSLDDRIAAASARSKQPSDLQRKKSPIGLDRR